MSFQEESSITIKIRHQAASLALSITIGLTVLKLGTGFLSGSIGILSEGIHSFLDLVSATLSYFTVRHAVKPADENHPFGHGKIETLSSLFEAILLIVAAGVITYEGVEHFFNPKPIQYQGLAITIIFLSMALSYWAFYHNRLAAQQTESSALHANALHFLADVVASTGILIGLILIQLTGWLVIDAIMAFAIAIYILLISTKQVKAAIQELSDIQLPEAEIQTIRSVLENYRQPVIEIHDLRTRKSGVTRHIDFHLVVCGQMSVENSHEVCDEMESKILAVFLRASVNIHVEPCEMEKTSCYVKCPIYQKRVLDGRHSSNSR